MKKDKLTVEMSQTDLEFDAWLASLNKDMEEYNSISTDYDLKDMEEKLGPLPRNERIVLVYQWIKTGRCSFEQFEQLICWITLYASA